MAKSLLDTDILSEYLKGHDATVAARARLYAQEHGFYSVTSVTAYEIIFGLELKAATAQREKFLNWLRQNEEVTPIADDYLLAARINAKARRSGSVLELPDCLIASVAVRLSLTLVTGNTEDFSAIQRTGIGLVIENWRVSNDQRS